MLYDFIPALLRRRLVARDQIQLCNILNGNGNKDRGRVRARRVSMAEVKGHRCSKKQMPDVSCYTASPADRDIIFIKPEVPFLLIGATE